MAEKSDKSVKKNVKQAADKVAKAVSKAVKKVKRQNVTEALLYIYASFNNTIITLTNLNGDVLCWKTAGSCGLRGSRKSTPFAGQMAAETVAKTAKEMGVKAMSVFVSGPGPARESSIRALCPFNFTILRIVESTGIPFNGCKPPKDRRV